MHKPLLDFKDDPLRNGVNHLEKSREGGRITPYESSFCDEDLEECLSYNNKKIDFDLPKID
jgi:hypothetical protein